MKVKTIQQVKLNLVLAQAVCRQFSYINKRTNINGSTITVETLLRKAKNAMYANMKCNLNNFFEKLGSNTLVE